MKNIAIKALATSLVCLLSVGVATAAPEKAPVKKQQKPLVNKAPAKKAPAKHEKVAKAGAEERLELNACNKKKAGEWTKYSYQGATFNGVCEKNEHGKLQFKAPAPNQ